jgi:hypothetical protein
MNDDAMTNDEIYGVFVLVRTIAMRARILSPDT